MRLVPTLLFRFLFSEGVPDCPDNEQTVPKFNEQKKTLGQKTPSDQEIWSAISYLDFEIDEKPSTCNAIIALAAALLIICVTVCLLRARGL
jgi:hypothetical protein